MKKNSTKYFLGLALLAVWGLLGFRVYHKMNPKNNWKVTPHEISIGETKNALDSFSLSLDYNSPFKVIKGSTASRTIAVNTPSRTNSNSSNRNLTARKINKKEKPKPVPFPNVSYKGNISSKNGRTIALVKIDNQIMNLEMGETFEKVLLQKIYTDSIEVSFAGRDSVIMKGD